ncbi:hypothetical protein ACQPXS_35560 [Streptomyces sp. CA-142005]|uniref:hypothetical protein n=1 Tax=Streptomyces sp. CA-142005 TaxID=3240052 RepID=UPI003D8F7360
MSTLHPLCPPTHSAPLPVVRAAVFAVVGSVLGASARHLAAGGPVPWPQSAMAVAALFAVGLVGTRRPRSLAEMVAVCGAAQAGLHLFLATAHAHSPEAPTAVPGHAHHAADAHQAWHERLHGSPAMTVVHAVTAVVIAFLLYRADTVCWSLARGLTTTVEAVRARIATVRALLGNHTATPGPRLPMPALARPDRQPPKEAALADAVTRRGPPQAELDHAN